MPGTGKLIVFEGLRGAGKSTCLRTVASVLRARGHEVVETSEPTHTTTPGALARRILRGEQGLLDPRSFQLLCAADRLEHVAHVIRPALAAGKVVLCDRYVLSSVAHAPTADVPFPWQWVLRANMYAPAADLTLVLFVPAEVGERRVLERDGRLDALAPSATTAPRFYVEGSELAVKFAHSAKVAWVNGMYPPDLAVTFALDEIEPLLSTPEAA